MINGVKVKKLFFHCDERGRLAEILRCDDEIFLKFGQVYITTVYPGVIKAWHLHHYQTDSLACIKGMAKLVLYDARSDSASKGELMEFFIGEHNMLLIQIPPYIYHGFRAIGEEEAIIINITDQPYNREKPDEYRLDPFSPEIPYDWQLKHG